MLQIGRRGKSTGNTDTNNVHQPADMFVHASTNELFVADGYGNQRVIVFDADTGKFKRMWGAFGNTPPAAMAPNPAQCRSALSRGDGHPAVRPRARGQGVTRRDRLRRRSHLQPRAGVHDRRQVPPAGEPHAPTATWRRCRLGFAFSSDPKQQFLYVVDSGPMRVVVFDRETLTQIGAIGMRGPKPGEFDIVHHMAADSKGNLYTAEIVTNRRAQRFVIGAAR